MTSRFVPPITPLPLPQTTAASNGGAVVVERTYRQLPASYARILENAWVAAGVAGFVLAAFMGGWLWQERASLGELAIAWRVIAITFLIVNGVYAVVRFGLDEWLDLAHVLALEAEIRDLLAELDEQEADNAVLRTELHQAQLNLDALRRRRAEPAEPTPVPPTPDNRIVQCARIILQRWQHDVSYARDVLTEKQPDGRQIMTEAEWKKAIDALELAGAVGRGGPGGRSRVIVGDKDNVDAMLERVRQIIE